MDSNQAKGILYSLQSKKRVLLLGALLLLVSSLLGLTLRIMDETNRSGFSSRVERVVHGSDWKYRVDPVLETKFGITAQPNLPKSELKIQGRGCNNMGAYVVESDKGDIRTIRGKQYRLDAGESTMMECLGEAATYDEQLSAEFEKIFQSLQ